MRTSRTDGFTLIELLISLVLTSLLIVGLLGTFSAQARMQNLQSLTREVQDNLRAAIDLVTEELRASGAGAPDANMAIWVPWVTGLTGNPTIVQGANGAPDRISLVGCFDGPVAELDEIASAGDTAIEVDDASAFDDDTRRYILIGYTQPAHVTGVNGDELAIDVNPTVPGVQGLPAAFGINAPICRVDVRTFQIVTTNGRSSLHRLDHQGTDGVGNAVADGIEDLQVSLTGGRFDVTVTGISELAGPLGGQPLARTLSSSITLRN